MQQNLPKTKVPVSVGIPFDLLQETDEIVMQKKLSRSEYIVLALKEKNHRTKTEK